LELFLILIAAGPLEPRKLIRIADMAPLEVFELGLEIRPPYRAQAGAAERVERPIAVFAMDEAFAI